MKLLLLKTLLRRKQKDEGFTLPIVMAIGLVMILLSAVELARSGEENIIAISQEGSADALAAAELGVSRYRDLLLNNRVLAVNDLDNWAGLNGETCDAISSAAGGWADNNTNTGWRTISLDENASSADLNSDGDTNDTLTIGSYRIVDYQYDQNPFTLVDDSNFDQVDDANNDFSTPPDGESDAIGTLQVQGRDASGSVAQIQVTIPLGVNTQDLDDLSPALWIEQNNPTNIGQVNVDSNGNGVFSESTDGNIVLYRPNGCVNPGLLAGESAISDARRIPDGIVDADITSFTRRSLNSDITSETTTATGGQYPANFFDTDPSVKEIVLGTSLDDNNTNGTQALHTNGFYYYTTGTSSLTVDAGESIIADGNSKVILHVGGNLVINTGSVGEITRIVNSQFGIKPDEIGSYLEIHVENNVTIDGEGTLNMSGLLRVGGTINITNNSTVNILGAIWTNQWNNNGGGTVNITLDDHKYYSITSNRTAAPLTYRPSGWETQEATP